MQTTIYYKEEDRYLMDKLEKKSSRERKSKSAIILSILENYFESDQKVGSVLKDLDAVESSHLSTALKEQTNREDNKRIGEILLEKGQVREVDLDRALAIQDRAS